MTVGESFLRKKATWKNPRKSQNNKNKKVAYLFVVAVQDWWFNALPFKKIYLKLLSKIPTKIENKIKI